MKLTIITLAAFVCLVSTPAFAQTWSGFLVNSECYESRLHNTDPWDTSIYVDRDKDSDIRLCSPNAKTKSFALVDHDGLSFKLDPAGNAKAAEIARQAVKKQFLKVVVTGEKSKDTIQVNSIAPQK
jgi:hypothetical protein